MQLFTTRNIYFVLITIVPFHAAYICSFTDTYKFDDFLFLTFPQRTDSIVLSVHRFRRFAGQPDVLVAIRKLCQSETIDEAAFIRNILRGFRNRYYTPIHK